MAVKKVSRRKDETDFISNSPEVRTTRGAKVTGKNGADLIKGRILTLVGDQQLKELMRRQKYAEDKLITDGKGGEELQDFSMDYCNNYKFSAQDKKQRKPIDNPANKTKATNILLRTASEMEEFK